MQGAKKYLEVARERCIGPWSSSKVMIATPGTLETIVFNFEPFARTGVRMRPRFLVVLAMLVGCAAAQAALPTVVPIFPSKSVRTFDAASGGTSGAPVPSGSFPAQALEESPDGQRYQIQLNGQNVWVPKSDVRPKENIDVKQMCSTVVASIQAGATRNANEACRAK